MKKKKRIYALLLCILISVLAVCLWKMLGGLGSYAEGRAYYSDAAERHVSESKAAPPGQSDTSAALAAPISVDFAVLSQEYPDIIGWIYSEGTAINHPIVQTDNNDTYLHAAPDGSYLYAGSIYADYRSIPAFSCVNTVIYGHRMADGSMFAALRDYRDESYYPEHSEIWILTPERDYCAKVIAGAIVPADDGIYNAITDADAVRKNVGRLIENSTFASEYEWDGIAPIVTLSTCTYEFNNARYVLICALE